MNLRLLAFLCAAVPVVAQRVPSNGRQGSVPFEVEEATIAQVHAAMKAGQLTCTGLVRSYVARITAYDKTGPALNALVLLNPEAEAQAAELDRQFTQRGLTGPLHCVPTIVKDNFETKGLPTSDGALVFAHYSPERDAFQIARIKAAGAIVLAKSNMAEWAFSPYETLSSVLPGYTRNPYALNRVTAGSSGGTAAAVAASLGLVGLGSDTGNSIRGPSAHNSLVGIRSTMGFTSRAGVFPLNLRADIAGPMARTVEDAARVLAVIAGPDPDDPVTEQSRGHLPAAAQFQPNPEALRNARIGVLHQAYERDSADAEILQIFAGAREELVRAGATVVDVASVDDLPSMRQNRAAGPCMGFKYDLNQFLAARSKAMPVHSLAEILASNGFHPTVQRRLEQAEKDPENGPGSAACEADDRFRQQVRDVVTKTMDRLHLDALIYPTWSNPPRLIGDLNSPAGDNSQFFAPTTGFPAVNVPMGFSRGGTLPAGITFFGRPWTEPKLLGLSYAYEQATHHRRPPASTPPLR